MKSGSVAAIAAASDFNGISPSYVWVWHTALVIMSGWPGGQTAPTVQPASANAIANRAVGNQRSVVAIKTVGFNVIHASGRSLGCDVVVTVHRIALRCCSPAKDRTAVHIQNLTGDMASPVGGKEQDCVGHVIGQRNTLQRYSLFDFALVSVIAGTENRII